MNCFAGEVHVVNKDSFPQYLDTIRPLIKKALTLSYIGRAASAVTSRIYTTSPGPAQHNDRLVPTQGLCGAIKTETPCSPSSAQITIITGVRTYL